MGEDADLNRVTPVESLPPAGGRSIEASPNELWEWLRLLNRRKALIVGSGLVAVALMALIIAQATPMYKASARLMLDTRTFKVVSTEAALSGVDTLNYGAIQSELEVIQSEFLIGRVVDRLGLASNPDFNGTRPPGFLDATLEPMREMWHNGIASLLSPQAAPPAQQQAAPARTGKVEDSDPSGHGTAQCHLARPHVRDRHYRREPGRHDVRPHRQRDSGGLSGGPGRQQERGEPTGHRMARGTSG
jgi:hypothetical protein